MVKIEFSAADLESTARKLSAISLDPVKGLHEPFTRVTYQEALDPERLQFPQQLLSLYYHPIYKELTREQIWNLSLHETINFFSINVHGERSLVKDIEDRLYVPSKIGGAWAVGNYLQHFVHEENSHTYMLSGYCYRYGDGIMADHSLKIGDPPLSNVCRDLLFFGRVYIFESFLDYLNCDAMRDDTLDTTVRQIHRFHHMEEARHMSFDRAAISYCVSEAARLGLHEELDVVSDLLANFGKIALQRLYSPNVYKSLGIADATTIAREIQKIPERIEIERAWISKSDGFLRDVGLFN